jgi:hemolysin activation/secretion protein
LLSPRQPAKEDPVAEQTDKADAVPAPKRPKAKVKSAKEDPVAKQVDKTDAGRQDTYKLTKLELQGDSSFLMATGLYDKMRKQLVGKELTDNQIDEVIRETQKQLIDAGYYLASIWPPPTNLEEGVLVLQVDKGRVGKQAFYAPAAGASTNKIPYSGRHYSETQLRRRLASLKEGQAFNYFPFYSLINTINAQPDLTVDTDLKVRAVRTNDLIQRYVDMDYTVVREALPIHGALSVANSGTKATGDWRPTLTLQHLNLTRHDDVLTLNLGPISPNFKDLKSLGASYYLPNYWKNGGAFTLFGGYSDLDAKDVVEGINVSGKGWFVGLQQSYKLINSERHLLSISLGLVYRVMEDRLILTDPEGSWKLEPREVTIVPLSLALAYSSKQEDVWGGRNFITSQTIAHQAKFLGASSEAEMRTLRVNADGDYFIERLQAARIQPLGHWQLLAKADAQLASGPLVPAEQKAIGGMDSVRGFPERIVQGDNGISGSLEVRTPLMSTFWGSPYKSSAERKEALDMGKTVDRIQLLAFMDGGTVRLKKALGTKDSYTISGAGVGIRIALTQYLQFRLDWGVPLSGRKDVETSEEKIDAGGRYHLSLQGQF